MINVQPSNLLCEYSNNPIDVNRESPVLSWSIQEIDTKNKQSAYRVLVASKKELLGEETADIWDSGGIRRLLLQLSETEGIAFNTGLLLESQS